MAVGDVNCSTVRLGSAEANYETDGHEADDSDEVLPAGPK
jgi:hypothetical protein